MNDRTPDAPIREADTAPGRKMALFIVASAGVWVFAALLSMKLAGGTAIGSGMRRGMERSGGAAAGPTADHAMRADTGDTVMVSPRSAELRKQVDEHPDDRTALLELAASLQSDAKARPSPGLIMEAVSAYSRVLDLNPADADGLLGLANLCFEADILDKAVDYYARYLELRPEDLQAATDYSLALVQAGMTEKAISYLRPLADRHPERFQMRLTLAVAEKVAGHRERARAEAERALKAAPDEDAKSHIGEFLARLDRPENEEKGGPTLAAGDGAAETAPPGSISPAATLEQFFMNHQIVGPKVRRIAWPNPSKARIELADFPVEQMPPFAKEKFFQSARKALAAVPEPLEIELADASTGRVMLSFSSKQ